MNNLDYYNREMKQIAQGAGKRKGVGGGLVAWLMMLVGVVVTGTMTKHQQSTPAGSNPSSLIVTAGQPEVQEEQRERLNAMTLDQVIAALKLPLPAPVTNTEPGVARSAWLARFRISVARDTINFEEFDVECEKG